MWTALQYDVNSLSSCVRVQLDRKAAALRAAPSGCLMKKWNNLIASPSSTSFVSQVIWNVERKPRILIWSQLSEKQRCVDYYSRHVAVNELISTYVEGNLAWFFEGLNFLICVSSASASLDSALELVQVDEVSFSSFSCIFKAFLLSRICQQSVMCSSCLSDQPSDLLPN